jgi:hypothetical protein
MSAGVLAKQKGSELKLSAVGGTPASKPHLRGWTLGVSATSSKTATNSTAGYTTSDVGVVSLEGKITYLQHDGEACPLTVGSSYAIEFYVGAIADANYYDGDVAIVNGPNSIEIDLEDGSKHIVLEYDWQNRGAFTANGDVAPLPT